MLISYRPAGSKVEMTFRIETKVGQLIIPVVLSDRGDVASNEYAGAVKVRALLKEAHRVFGASYGFPGGGAAKSDGRRRRSTAGSQAPS